MKISPELFDACSYFIPRIMFLETEIAPKIEWGDIVQVLSDFPKCDYDLSSKYFWDIWFKRWEKLGNQYLLTYQQSPKNEYSIYCIRRSCACYHWAEFMYFSDADKKLEIRKTIRRNFLMYLDLLGIDYVYNNFEYDTLELPYFVFYPEKIKDNSRTMILCNGLDSMTEIEIFSIAEYFLKEGYAVFLFDAPGQGVNVGRTSLQLEFENLINIILKIIEKDSRLNSSFVGIAGISFGGYLALRAAYYFPKSFRVCINISGSPKVNDYFNLPRNLKEDFKFVFQKDDESMTQVLKQMYFEPTEGIFPPTLTIHGEKDDIFPVESILTLDKQLGKGHSLILFEKEAHVCLNKINQYIYDILRWTKQNF